jgi:hypothetical protein
MAMRKWITLAAATAAWAGLAPPVLAQSDTVAADVASAGKRVLRPDFFSSFAPVSALDMVNRVPGFSVDGGDGRRGFGENAGNVLIDGDRPSTKSDDIFTILSRIPASQVDYIELNEQGGSDGDARGKGQVVNVVRKTTAKLSGTYEANLELGERKGITPFGSASATLRRGLTTFDLNAAYFVQFNHFGGPESERAGNGTLISLRQEDGQNRYSEASLGGAIKTRLGGAKINLNGKVFWRHSVERRDGDVFDGANILIAREFLRSKGPDTELTYEGGGDIEFAVAPKLSTKVIGLYRSGSEQGGSQFDIVRVGHPTDRFGNTYRNRPAESILRVQNDWTGISRHAVQFGAEVAFNRLDAEFSAANATGGATTQFPASNVLVRETRFEPFVSDVWTLSPSWTLEAGLIAEASRLTLSGDSSGRRNFLFWKPRVAATWTVDKLTTVELRAERQVSQLDFGDFATSVDLGNNGQVDAGNADLVPEKTTTLSALVRRKFMDRGSIQLLGSYVLVSDTQDLVPVGPTGSQFDGIGNIGKSKRWNAELEITLPFDWVTKSVGITGMELKYVGHYHGSRVTDPVTGFDRRRSGENIWHQGFNFRHDIAKSGISWGVNTFIAAPNVDYFLNQVRRFQSGPELFAYVEYTKWKAGTLKFQIGNVTDVSLTRDRFFYTGTRASGTIDRILRRERSRDTRFQLSLAGKF